MLDYKTLGDSIIDSVRGFVGKVEAALNLRMDSLAQQLKDMPEGKRGKDGASVALEQVEPMITDKVAAAFAELPAPKNGEPGKDADLEEIKSWVKQAVDEIPRPKDGNSVTREDLAPVIADEVAKAFASVPVPKDGVSVPADEVQRMVEDAVAKAVSAIEVPKNGEPGRDAAHLEILPAIDVDKAYPRGCYAKHAGGLWRSFEATAGMRGWECIVDGIAGVTLDQITERGLVISVQRSSGAVVAEALEIPAMIYRNVYREGEKYVRGDTVTWGGSLWYCKEDTTDKPADLSGAWQLAVKKGRDGRDLTAGEKR